MLRRLRKFIGSRLSHLGTTTHRLMALEPVGNALRLLWGRWRRPDRKDGSEPVGGAGIADVWISDGCAVESWSLTLQIPHRRPEPIPKAVAALNHPNICTLYDVGPNYLVMEYVEGSTLAERVQQGPIPGEITHRWTGRSADGMAATSKS
jgi:hypothetical protein